MQHCRLALGPRLCLLCTLVFCARFVVQDVTEHRLLHSYLAMQGNASTRAATDLPQNAVLVAERVLEYVDILSFV